MPKINQTHDFLERVGWTFLQAYIGLGAIDWLAAGINLSLVHQLVAAAGAAAAATIKVLLAQRLGASDSGALPDPTKPPPVAEP